MPLLSSHSFHIPSTFFPHSFHTPSSLSTPLKLFPHPFHTAHPPPPPFNNTLDDEDDEPKPRRAPSRKVAQGDFDPNDLKAGYLEKRIGEGSGRGAIPVEAWKWQKRWFIFTDTKAMLYYFKSPDDPPNYRGAINIR